MSVSGDRLRLPAVQPVRDAGAGQPGGTGERTPETGGLRTDAAAGACRRVEQAPDTARELAAEGCYDLLFFDLPGTVNSAGILRTIAQMDYIFAPVSADKAVLESTLSFLDVLQRMMLGKETSRLKGLYLFWNQVDKRETSGLYEKYGQVVADMGLPMLQTRIPDTKRFRKEADGTGRTVFRSTLLAPDRRMLAGSGIPELTREIATILKLEGYEEAAE